jgi:hypothetical protein
LPVHSCTLLLLLLHCCCPTLALLLPVDPDRAAAAQHRCQQLQHCPSSSAVLLPVCPQQHQLLLQQLQPSALWLVLQLCQCQLLLLLLQLPQRYLQHRCRCCSSQVADRLPASLPPLLLTVCKVQSEQHTPWQFVPHRQQTMHEAQGSAHLQTCRVLKQLLLNWLG